jgi:hypothetical protein
MMAGWRPLAKTAAINGTAVRRYAAGAPQANIPSPYAGYAR